VFIRKRSILFNNLNIYIEREIYLWNIFSLNYWYMIRCLTLKIWSSLNLCTISDHIIFYINFFFNFILLIFIWTITRFMLNTSIFYRTNCWMKHFFKLIFSLNSCINIELNILWSQTCLEIFCIRISTNLHF
jgi:hypothetical protein